jgi:hypothetical protein
MSLVSAASIRASSSSAAVDSDDANEDGPPTLSSTKSRTQAAEARRASRSFLENNLSIDFLCENRTVQVEKLDVLIFPEN